MVGEVVGGREKGAPMVCVCLLNFMAPPRKHIQKVAASVCWQRGVCDLPTSKAVHWTPAQGKGEMGGTDRFEPDKVTPKFQKNNLDCCSHVPMLAMRQVCCLQQSQQGCVAAWLS